MPTPRRAVSDAEEALAVFLSYKERAAYYSAGLGVLIVLSSGELGREIFQRSSPWMFFVVVIVSLLSAYYLGHLYWVSREVYVHVERMVGEGGVDFKQIDDSMVAIESYFIRGQRCGVVAILTFVVACLWYAADGLTIGPINI